jgi:hypothetical protein
MQLSNLKPLSVADIGVRELYHGCSVMTERPQPQNDTTVSRFNNCLSNIRCRPCSTQIGILSTNHIQPQLSTHTSLQDGPKHQHQEAPRQLLGCAQQSILEDEARNLTTPSSQENPCWTQQQRGALPAHQGRALVLILSRALPVSYRDIPLVRVPCAIVSRVVSQVDANATCSPPDSSDVSGVIPRANSRARSAAPASSPP